MTGSIKRSVNRYDYIDVTKSLNDGLFDCFNKMPAGEPICGVHETNARGYFCGFKYYNNMYGSLMFMSYAGNIVLMGVSNGVPTYKTV